MNRRNLLGALALAAALAAWSGLQGRADDPKAVGKDQAHGAFMDCAKACAICQNQCESCFNHCAHLVADGKKEHVRSMRSCNDCGEICATAAKLSARQGPMVGLICDSCAKACDQCGAECEKFPSDDHMKACAKACRDCAAACREMLKHIGHEHGEKK
jgi:hypothetical protein